MKCRKCGGSAALELRRHNAAFCTPHFIEFFRKQVAEAIHKHRMLTREEPILVAVSGGKDSLALWDVLLEDGYQTAGLYLDLGIFEYSQESKAKCEAFAATRGQKLYVERVAEAIGAPIPEVQKVTRRPTCSACGLSKRYLMNRAALEQSKPDLERVSKYEAIMLSMTPRERRLPRLIDGSRRRRIAAGSGTSVSEVNRLLKDFDQARTLMKRLKHGPRGLAAVRGRMR